MFRVITSTSARARLDAAAEFLRQLPRSTEVVIVGASRGAADDLARTVARRAGATFGITRFSLTQLAARAVAVRLAGLRLAPGTQAGAEATAARAVFDAGRAGDLSYFAPVAGMPGFPKALARTLHELRLAGVGPGRLADIGVSPSAAAGQPSRELRPIGQRDASAGRSAPTSIAASASADIGRLLARVEEQLDRAAVVDRAALFRLAAKTWASDGVRWAGLPLVLLDVPLDSAAERALVGALVARAPEALATVPDGDQLAQDALTAFGGVVDVRPDPAPATADLANLRCYVFTIERPRARERTGDVRLFSAPGEGREAVEIVRRILDEAARGVPFDDMAVFLRTPQHYLGLLEHACARGGVPVYFDRGTQRPDPAGRAFVALLSCACEGLSAKRFDEYLSLGQVPQIGAGRAGRPGGADGADGADRHGGNDARSDNDAHGSNDVRSSNDGGSADLQVRHVAPVPPLDEVFGAFPLPGLEPDEDTPDRAAAEEPWPDSDEEAVVAGTLRSPWKWEELIVESAVVAGRSRADGKARWRRRLDGLAADYRYRIAELRRDEPESARIGRYERDLRNLTHLRAFALPIIDALAEWPEEATWGEWLDRFSALAAGALKRPTRVLQTLADLRPMADVGPIALEEARDVLHDRLATLDWEPPARRYGCLFVGTPHQARGRSFRVAFVPGLAERVVPQRPREDPLLLDELRKAIDRSLMRQDERGSAERLLLKIAIGAASERVYLSYPRLDVAETRARVPSFYALDVMRAITGTVPDHRVLAAEAAEEAGANLAWPAPADPHRAIDDLEHDLATLKPLLDSRDPVSVKGHAHYLLGLNEALRRSVISRWARGRSAWSSSDGLISVAPGTAAALDAQRLARRRYSVSALQRFATCPYQFLLATVHRLEPWEDPEPLVRMDPLTRGSLFHRAQAELYRALEAKGALPVTPQSLPEATRTLDAVLRRVAAEYEEMLAPAIERVWRDEIADLRRDLSIWVQKIAGGSAWHPLYFEFSFGLGAGGSRGSTGSPRPELVEGREESESAPAARVGVEPHSNQEKTAAARASGGGARRAFEINEGRDPRSLPDPIVVDGSFVLHGSVDLIEHRRDLDVLRITDHKTGKNRSNPDLIVGGGAVLQPVVYSMAIEQGLGKKVTEGRLFYCTTAGGFTEHTIPINDYTRSQGLQVLTIIDRAVEHGFLAAAPAERACTWCDFRPVCGPREEERVKRKAPSLLADLEALRSMR